MLHPSPETFSTHPASQWTGVVKVRFLECLAQKGNVRVACARVGLSAETAYRQRRRDPVFARSWAAATALARRSAEQVLTDRAIDGIEEDVWFRGELAGTRRRYDSRLLLAHLARLDRMVEQDPAAQEDAERFDELLAVLVGAECPADLADADGVPVCREIAVEMAKDEAREAELDKIQPDDWREFGKKCTPEELEQRELAEEAAQRAGERAVERAAAETGRIFDERRAAAQAAVDAALEPTSDAGDDGEAGAEGEVGQEPELTPRTVSTASTPPSPGTGAKPPRFRQNAPRSPFQSERRR